jgi:hypothetical protein
MTIDKSHDRSPDALADRIIQSYADAQGGLPDGIREEIISFAESGMPEDVVESMVEFFRQGHIRDQLTVGVLLDSISERRLGDRQATPNELLRVAEVGKDLFYAAIAHRDATPEVLKEACELWGPLVNAAREECGFFNDIIPVDPPDASQLPALRDAMRAYAQEHS